MIFHLKEDLNELIASMKRVRWISTACREFFARTRVNFMRVVLIECRSNVLKVARKRKSWARRFDFYVYARRSVH